MDLIRCQRSPVVIAGLFLLLLGIAGCQSVSTPEQVTVAFWEDLTDGNVDSARQWVTEDSRRLVAPQPNLEDAALETGAAVIEGNKARVATVLTLEKLETNKKLSFDTLLLQENRQWRVDYRQTLNNLSFLPLGDLLESLKSIGDAVNRELENQIPLFENQIRSFSEELKKQLDEFRKRLDQPRSPKPHQPNTI